MSTGSAPHREPTRLSSNAAMPSPERLSTTRLLSNGRYHVLLSERGSGYSRWNDLAVTRWREDLALDDNGLRLFLRDRDAQRVWPASAPVGPTNAPDHRNGIASPLNAAAGDGYAFARHVACRRAAGAAAAGTRVDGEPVADGWVELLDDGKPRRVSADAWSAHGPLATRSTTNQGNT